MRLGWDGFLYPWTFSAHDFEPITGRIHQPPPSHQTFQGRNFVICSLWPRKLHFDPLAAWRRRRLDHLASLEPGARAAWYEVAQDGAGGDEASVDGEATRAAPA